MIASEVGITPRGFSGGADNPHLRGCDLLVGTICWHVVFWFSDPVSMNAHCRVAERSNLRSVINRLKWWRWRELNPRANAIPKRFSKLSSAEYS